MSRRTVTTLSIQVRLRIPPGSNTVQVLDYVRLALAQEKKNIRPEMPLASLDTDSMLVKLEKKETVYL